MFVRTAPRTGIVETVRDGMACSCISAAEGWMWPTARTGCFSCGLLPDPWLP